MEQEEFDSVLPLPGREEISLVRRKGDKYWQMMNSDGDMWGKFYPDGNSYSYDASRPWIYRTYFLTSGKRPFRIYDDNFMLRGEKFVDTNGYFSDHVYDDQSGYYRDGNVEAVKWCGWWLFRDCDGKHSQRVFEYDEDNYFASLDFKRLVNYSYYNYCFEKDGKIKCLYNLEILHTSDNGIQLLKEDQRSPIITDVKYSKYIPIPLYFFKDKNGELSESFSMACSYNDGWAKVKKRSSDRVIHYRDENGNLSEPFIDGTDYRNGYAVVLVEQKAVDFKGTLAKKYCIRDIKGNLSTKWFESEYGALKEIELGNAKKYFEKRTLDTKVDEEKLKSYYYVGNKDKERFVLVQKYIAGDFQLMSSDGNLSEPFYFYEDVRWSDNRNGRVKKFWNSGMQLRDPENGNLSQEVYFIAEGYDSNDCAVVQLKPNGPYYLMDKDGNMSDPFGEIHRERNGFRAVKKSFFHPYQIIDKNWHLSKKKYPDKESVETDILSENFIFDNEDEPTIKPRPKKVKQNSNKSQTIEAIASMIGESDTIKVDDEQSSKTDLERYLDNEISVYELDEECFKGEILDKIIKHETNNYLQAIMYYDSDEKKAEIRKQALENTEYIKHMATLHLQSDTKTIDYETAPIF